MNMFSTQFATYIFLVQFIIFYNQYKFVMAIHGPNVRQASSTEFPGLASINGLYQSIPNIEIEMSQKCTGILVSKQDIITADHCVRDTFREGFKVLVGSIDLTQAMEFYPMFVLSYEHWIIYRRRTLRENETHDISVIKLLENVPENVEIAPIGNIQSNLLYGLNVDIIGWGRLMDETKPRILHTASVRIMTLIECQRQLLELQGILFNMDEKVLCSVGNPFAVLGHGDSGGPLLFFGTIIGVNIGVIPSFGGTTRPNQLNIHLNLRMYLEYIQYVIFRLRMNI